MCFVFCACFVFLMHFLERFWWFFALLFVFRGFNFLLQWSPQEPLQLGVKLHVDSVGSHPKIFFLSWSLFSIAGLSVFGEGYRVGRVLPKFVGVGCDTKSHGYIQSALKDVVKLSKTVYNVSKECHKVVISCDPVILSGDGAVRTVYTGGTVPNQSTAACFEV